MSSPARRVFSEERRGGGGGKEGLGGDGKYSGNLEPGLLPRPSLFNLFNPETLAQKRCPV